MSLNSLLPWVSPEWSILDVKSLWCMFSLVLESSKNSQVSMFEYYNQKNIAFKLKSFQNEVILPTVSCYSDSPFTLLKKLLVQILVVLAITMAVIVDFVSISNCSMKFFSNNLKMKQVLFLLLAILALQLQYARAQATCPQGQLPFAGTCKDIFYIEGCATYSADNRCQTCEYGFELSQGRCLITPRTNQDCCASYSSDGSCLKCSGGLYSLDPYCYRNEIYGCILKQGSKCLVCEKGLAFWNGICVVPIARCASYNSFGECTSCQANFRLVNNYCYPNPQIPFCQTTNEYGCIECNKGYFLTAQRNCSKFAPGCLQYWQEKCIACHPRFQLVQSICSIWGCAKFNFDGCAQCQSGFQLQNGKCYFNGCAKAVNNKCVQCKGGLRLAEQGCVPDAGFQCKECPSGYQFIGGKCIKTIFGCQQYNNIGLCAQCARPFQLTVNGQCQILGCVRYCAQGCEQCNAPFQLSNYICAIPNCSQYSNSGCIKCDDGYLLSQNRCILKDPNCLAYDWINGNTICTKCIERYFLFSGSCRAAEKGCVYDAQGRCTCKPGFNPKDNKCEIVGCSSYDWQTCLSCISPFTYNSQTKSCQISNCLQYSWTGCARCESGWLLNRGLCVPAQPNCLSYNDRGVCVACNQGFLLTPSNICIKNIPFCVKFSSDNLSCVQCQPGYAINNGVCRQVLANCKQMDFASSLCACCQPDFYLSNGRCLNNDPFCIKYTKRNSTTQYCSQCQSGYYFSFEKNQCVSEQPGCVYLGSDCVDCIRPFIYHKQSATCYIPGCLKYSPTECINCATPFQLKDKACIIEFCSQYSRQACTKCRNGYMLINSGLCVLINPNCLQYNGAQCSKCRDGFVLVNGNCVVRDQNCIAYGQNGVICTKCNEGYYIDPNGKCQLTQAGCIYQNGLCSSCTAPFTYQPANRTCTVDNCLRVNRTGCVQCCSPFALQLDQRCAIDFCIRVGGSGCLQCKPMYHLSTGRCVADDPNCLAYNPSGDCEVCANSFVLDKSGECVPSSNSCLQYCQSDKSKCLSCGDNYFLNRFYQCEKKDPNCQAYTNGACSKCTDKYFLFSEICFPYTPGCVSYSGKDCTSCRNGFELKNGECFRWKQKDLGLLGGDDRYDFDITPIDVRQSKYYINNLSPASAIGKYFFSSFFDASFQDCSLTTLEGTSSKGWRAKANDTNQFIGVTIDGQPATFYALQLESVGDFYITEFYLEYSVDGKQFIRVQTPFQVSKSIKTNLTTVYFTGIYAKAIRIRITSYNGWPACRIQFFYYDMLRFRKISNLKSLTYLQETISSNFVDRVDNQIYINQIYFFDPSASCTQKDLCFTGLQLCEPRNINALSLTFSDTSNTVQEFYLTYSVDGRSYNCFDNCRKFSVQTNNNSFSLQLKGLKAQGVRIYPTKYQNSPRFSPVFYYE